MKKIVAFLFFFHHFVAQAQPLTKQVLVEGSGPSVVLLHGGTFDFTAYEGHAKLLADSFTVIRLQQFNVQAADEGWLLPKTYSVSTESKAVKATLDSIRITMPVILAGHSYGGVIAVDFAATYPEIVHALLLVEAPLFHLAKVRGKYTPSMKQIVDLTQQFTPQATITEEMIKAFRCKMTDCKTFEIRKHPMWPKWLKQKNRLRGLSAVPAYTISVEKLQAFQKPVLIVTGNTTIAANQVIDNLLSQAFPNAKKASLPGDHIAIYQNPETFVQIMKAFLRGQ